MSRAARLGVVLCLDVALIGVLVGAGITAHSLGVLAEGGDYLVDAAAIGSALLATLLARQPPSARRPRGYPRATSIAALLNAAWLTVLMALVAVGAVDRLVRGAGHVHGLLVLAVSGAAAVVMLAGALVLRGDRVEGRLDADLHVRAVLLDTAADAAAAAGVAASGAVILVTGSWYWLDPTVALAIAVVVGYHAVRLLLQTLVVLRQPSPSPAGTGSGIEQ